MPAKQKYTALKARMNAINNCFMKAFKTNYSFAYQRRRGLVDTPILVSAMRPEKRQSQKRGRK